MIIVGERINSTRESIREAIKSRNAALLVKIARQQLDAGAHFIDVNCAVTAGDEIQDIDWLISVIQSEIPDPNLCIDSPNVRAIERALSIYKGRGELMINSITGEEERITAILPLAVKYKTRLIALTMDAGGMPDTAAQRFDVARKIFDRVRTTPFPLENLYFDPLIRPIATEPLQARAFLDSLPLIKSLGGVKTICGLSNVSFGLPARTVINASFVTMAMAYGLDAAILDPLDKNIMVGLLASRALLCQDEYCAGYIQAFRQGALTK